MAKPDDDRSPPSVPLQPAVPGPSFTAPRHPYGNFRERTAEGQWYFEWTPFSPAVKAWENAQWHLKQARDRLIVAREIKGFVISEIEQDYTAYMDDIKTLTEAVGKAHRESGEVVQVLEAAHTDYANARDASSDEYLRMQRTIDRALADQGRPVRPPKPPAPPEDDGISFIPWF